MVSPCIVGLRNPQRSAWYPVSATNARIAPTGIVAAPNTSRRAPATTSITNTTKQSTTTVPRSGSSMIRLTVAPTPSPTGRIVRRQSSISRLRLANNRDAHRMTASFAISDGCTLKKEMSNQRREPLTLSPRNSTATSSTSDTAIAAGANTAMRR